MDARSVNTTTNQTRKEKKMTVKFVYVRSYDYDVKRHPERVLTVAYEFTTPVGDPVHAVRFGWAICNPLDHFKKATGRDLATSNMTSRTPGYYGEVVCGQDDFDASARIAALQFIARNSPLPFVQRMVALRLNLYYHSLKYVERQIWGPAGYPLNLLRR